MVECEYCNGLFDSEQDFDDHMCTRWDKSHRSDIEADLALPYEVWIEKMLS